MTRRFPRPSARAAACAALGFGAGMWTGVLLEKRAGARLPDAGGGASVEFQRDASGLPSRVPGAATTPDGSFAAGKGGGGDVPDLKGLSPREVLKKLAVLKDAALRREAAFRLLKNMEPEERLPWLKRVVEQAGGVFDDQDPAALSLMFGTMDDLLHALVSAGPEEALAGAGAGEATDMLTVAAVKWAELDPAAAKAWFEKELSKADSPLQKGGGTAKRVAAVLTRISPAEGLDWAARLPAENGIRGAALEGAVTEALKTDPREAARALDAHTGGVKDAGALAERVAAALAEEDPRGALKWASGTAPDVRRAAVAGALERRAREDFDSALQAVKGLGGEAGAHGLAAVLGEAPPERLPEVAALLEARPEGAGRASASGDLMRVWTDKNPEEASAWMKRQPPGPVRDEAISAFVRWADVRDPEAAFLWADTVSDPQKRVQTIDHIIGQLGEKAPEAVEAWLASNPALPEEEKERVRQRAGGGGGR